MSKMLLFDRVLCKEHLDWVVKTSGVTQQWVEKRWDQGVFKGEVPNNLPCRHACQWTFPLGGIADCIEDTTLLLICWFCNTFHHCGISPLRSDFGIFAYISQDHSAVGGWVGLGRICLSLSSVSRGFCFFWWRSPYFCLAICCFQVGRGPHWYIHLQNQGR